MNKKYEEIPVSTNPDKTDVYLTNIGPVQWYNDSGWHYALPHLISFWLRKLPPTEALDVLGLIDFHLENSDPRFVAGLEMIKSEIIQKQSPLPSPTGTIVGSSNDGKGDALTVLKRHLKPRWMFGGEI